MEADGLMQGFARVAFKISATFLVLCVIVLLWLRPEGTGRVLLPVVIAINTLTATAAAVIIRIAAKKDAAAEPSKNAIIDVLEQASVKKHEKGVPDEQQ